MPQVFGIEHITYILISIVVAFFVCFFTKRYVKTDITKKITIKIVAGILFLIIFTNRLVLVFEHGNVNWMKMLTDSICSTSSYVLSLCLLFGKKNNKVLQFIWLICLGGGAITTFYPNFIGQHPSFLYPPTILGMMHHTWSAIVVIVVFLLGYLELSRKYWYCVLFGFTSYLTYGTFLKYVLGFDNPLYMSGPAIDGTIFTVWVMAPIFLVVYSLIILIVELVRWKKKKNI